MDLPQPFDVRKASHPLLPRQNSATASYAPAVKKPLRKLAVAERLRSLEALRSSARASPCISRVNMSIRSQSSKKVHPVSDARSLE